MTELPTTDGLRVCWYLALLVAAWVWIILISPQAEAQAWYAETGHVEFLSNVPLHDFIGTSDVLTGRIDLAENTVDFFVDLNTLDTGIGKRDKDMRKTLETDDYPFAEFFGTLLTAVDPAAEGPQPVEVEGDFTIHGITRTIQVPGQLTFSEEGLRIEASWTLLLEDYEIQPPRLLFLKVDEEQAITIDILLTPES
ncbi:MAG: YceI family protein [Rhodothermales bacterium]